MRRHFATVAVPFSIVLVLLLVTMAFRPDWHRAGVRMEIGRRFFDAGDYDRAIEMCDTVLQAIEEHAPALHLRGLSHDRLGEFDQALRDYRAAIELDPRFFDAINDRGIMLTKMGRLEEGLADFRRLVSLDPVSVSARVNYAFALHKAGRTDEAAGCLEVIGEDQRDETVQYLIASIAMAQQNWDSADEAFSAAIEINSVDVKTWLNRAIARWRLGRHQEAISDLERAAVLDEDWMLQSTIEELRRQINQSRPATSVVRLPLAG